MMRATRAATAAALLEPRAAWTAANDPSIVALVPAKAHLWLSMLVPAAVVAAAEPAPARPADTLAATRCAADWHLTHRTRFDPQPAGQPSARDSRIWQQATFDMSLTGLPVQITAIASRPWDLVSTLSTPMTATYELWVTGARR